MKLKMDFNVTWIIAPKPTPFNVIKVTDFFGTASSILSSFTRGGRLDMPLEPPATHTQGFLFQNEIFLFWDTLIQKIFLSTTKIKNFLGDVTDYSAMKEALTTHSASHTTTNSLTVNSFLTPLNIQTLDYFCLCPALKMELRKHIYGQYFRKLCSVHNDQSFFSNKELT